MTKAFDFVAFAKDFEATNGRPPTAEELDDAKWSHYGITKSTPEQVEAEVRAYKPSFGDRLKSGLSLLGHGFFRAVILLIQTPIYLTMLFFNLIKSTFFVFVVWFVSKLMMLLIIGTVEGFRVNDITEITGVSKIVLDFLFGSQFIGGGNPNFFPHPVVDAILIIVAIILFALILTFSKFEETH